MKEIKLQQFFMGYFGRPEWLSVLARDHFGVVVIVGVLVVGAWVMLLPFQTGVQLLAQGVVGKGTVLGISSEAMGIETILQLGRGVVTSWWQYGLEVAGF